MHFAVLKFLRGYFKSFKGRLELIVDAEFVQGHRWTKLLGFKKESVEMKKYMFNGNSAYMYARVGE